jgi:hypothetical protein
MSTQIKFGTSGWRAVMAEEFTFVNVRRAVNGIARYVRHRRVLEHGSSWGAIRGFWARLSARWRRRSFRLTV